MLVLLDLFHSGIRYNTCCLRDFSFPFKHKSKVGIGLVIAQTLKKLGFYYSFCEFKIGNSQSKKMGIISSAKYKLFGRLIYDSSIQRSKPVSSLNLCDQRLNLNHHLCYLPDISTMDISHIPRTQTHCNYLLSNDHYICFQRSVPKICFS